MARSCIGKSAVVQRPPSVCRAEQSNDAGQISAEHADDEHENRAPLHVNGSQAPSAKEIAAAQAARIRLGYDRPQQGLDEVCLFHCIEVSSMYDFQRGVTSADATSTLRCHCTAV